MVTQFYVNKSYNENTILMDIREKKKSCKPPITGF